MPNATPVSGTCNNWIETVNAPINWRQDNLRLDWRLNETTRLMLRYTQDSWRNDAPNLQSKLWGDDPFPTVDSSWDMPSRSLVVRLTKTLGAMATNTLQFSYSGNEITVTRGGTNPGLNDQVNAAIPGLFPDNIKLYGADRGHPVFFEGEAGFVKHVLGDWQVGAIVIATSGRPITVVNGTVPGLSGGPSGTGNFNNQRPNRAPEEPCRVAGVGRLGELGADPKKRRDRASIDPVR